MCVNYYKNWQKGLLKYQNAALVLTLKYFVYSGEIY